MTQIISLFSSAGNLDIGFKKIGLNIVKEENKLIKVAS